MKKVIGVTGGVGCGKSVVLDYLRTHYNCIILKSDEAAHRLYEPGGRCYGALKDLFAKQAAAENGGSPATAHSGSASQDAVSAHPLFHADGCFDRQEMAARMFRSPALRQKVNALLHPAVMQYIREQIAQFRAGNLQNPDGVPYDLFFLEAALLIENGFLADTDEMWYIYTAENIRRARLKKDRGYTDEKIDGIMKVQLSEAEFRASCSAVIDNSGTPEETQRQIDALLSDIV
jgi:dephospho-CoA kinase